MPNSDERRVKSGVAIDEPCRNSRKSGDGCAGGTLGVFPVNCLTVF